MIATKKTIQFGNHTLTLETGVIARQATGSVLVDLNGTVVLATAVGNANDAEPKDFFPLRVDYQEKAYANGRIPGGFFKREGRPSERETLIARLIDRPIRPLFPKQFTRDVQVVATVLSVHPDIDPDIPAMIGASAALAISGMPFQGPMAAARVGHIDGCYVLNPSPAQLKNSKLDLVVAGTESSVLMVESEAAELSESVMLGAVTFGHKQFQPVIELIKELAKEAGKPAWDWQPPEPNVALLQDVAQHFEADVTAQYQIQDKMQRQQGLRELRQRISDHYAAAEANPDTAVNLDEVMGCVEKLERQVVRGRILAGQRRIDGRDTQTVRNITTQTGLLPRTHGSALFTRGETQALAVVTLGTTKDAQITDGLLGENRETFMLHYNFPAYSVGEVGALSSPKRREIGHGRLAKRGLGAVMPNQDQFPYVTRLVSEITESNGSSSMATVCAGSLALMDAGAPIKAPVAGIAMGLIKEGEQFAVLSDILGDEDHLGDMDFKVAGTEQGITALQMDIKIAGITEEIMSTALEQARTGRLHILGIMAQSLQTPRDDLSPFAPRILTIRINPDKIKDVIGKGGSTIKALIEETGASIDIAEDGTVQIASVEAESGEAAKRQIERLTADVEVGRIYEGTVVRITDFGAFVNILPGKDGLVHISQIAHHRVADVSSELEDGQVVKVKVMEIDKQGRLKLSIKALLEKEPAE